MVLLRNTQGTSLTVGDLPAVEVFSLSLCQTRIRLRKSCKLSHQCKACKWLSRPRLSLLRTGCMFDASRVHGESLGIVAEL